MLSAAKFVVLDQFIGVTSYSGTLCFCVLLSLFPMWYVCVCLCVCVCACVCVASFLVSFFLVVSNVLMATTGGVPVVQILPRGCFLVWRLPA